MPTRCVAIGCINTASAHAKTAAQTKFEKVMKITFHKFPCNPVRRAEWIRIMNLEDKTITNRSRLCSLHFQEKYIDRTSLVCVRLRENAVPHIFEDPLYNDIEDETTVKKKVKMLPAQSVQATILTDPLNIDKIETDPLNIGKMEADFKQVPIIPTILTDPLNIAKTEIDFTQVPIIHAVCDKGTNTSISLLQEMRKSTQDKETRMSPERIWNMNFSNAEAIRKARRNEIGNLRKKIQSLQRKVWQRDKKIEIMKTILNELKIEKIGTI